MYIFVVLLSKLCCQLIGTKLWVIWHGIFGFFLLLYDFSSCFIFLASQIGAFNEILYLTENCHLFRKLEKKKRKQKKKAPQSAMVLSCQIKLNDRLNNFYVLFSEFNIVLDWQESIRYQVMMIQCLQQVNYLINKERERERATYAK